MHGHHDHELNARTAGQRTPAPPPASKRRRGAFLDRLRRVPARRYVAAIGVVVLITLVAALRGNGSGASGTSDAGTPDGQAASRAHTCPPAPERWVRRLSERLLVPGGVLRRAVLVGPAPGVDLGVPVLAGKVFFLAAELDGEGLEGDGDIATWAVGDPHTEHGAYVVIAADRNAYDNSPFGRELYGGMEYADPTSVRARECVLARR